MVAPRGRDQQGAVEPGFAGRRRPPVPISRTRCAAEQQLVTRATPLHRATEQPIAVGVVLGAVVILLPLALGHYLLWGRVLGNMIRQEVAEEEAREARDKLNEERSART